MGEGGAQGVGGNEGVAVAVAADPAADVQHIGQAGVRVGYLKGGFQLAVYAGHGAEEAEREIHDAVADFVGHRDFEMAVFIGLPQRPQHGLHLLLQSFFVLPGLVGALVEQVADLAVQGEDGLALHFGGVRGEYGGHFGVVQLLLQGFGAHALLLQQGKGVAEGGFGVVAGLAVRLAAALVMGVFGDIENLRKQAAGADEVFQLLVVELRQAARHHVLRCFAAQQRGYGFLHGAVGLRGQHGLQRAGEEGNVVEERRVFVGVLAGRFGHHGVFLCGFLK